MVEWMKSNAVALFALGVSCWVAWRQRQQGALIAADLEDRTRAIRVTRLRLRTVIGKAQNRLEKPPTLLHNLGVECVEFAEEIESLSAAIPGAETLGYSTAQNLRLVVRSQDAAKDAPRLLKELADQLERGGMA